MLNGGFRTQLLLLAAWCLLIAGCDRPYVRPENLVDVGLPDLRADQLDSYGDALPRFVKSFPISSVVSPDAKRRPISLAECMALALENGRVGEESIRVLAFEPAVSGADIDAGLAKFDAHLLSSMSWTNLDQPIGTAQQSLFTAAPTIEQTNATWNTELVKPLPTGGTAGITFKTDYQFTNQNALVNPAYIPVLQFTFEQPLLRGFGVFTNEVTSSHPGSELTPFPTSSEPGILLARNAFDQSRADFERRVQDLALNVEQAYWNLYCSYWILFSRDQALRQLVYEYQVARVRFAKNQFTVQDLAQLEEQYHSFRGQRLSALGSGDVRAGVLEAERQLRQAIGLPPEDGRRLVPSDVPTIAAYNPNWEGSLADALANRPELVKAREDVQRARLVLVREKNNLLPELRFFSGYDINAIGSRLDGSGSENALRVLASDHFNDWSLGLRFEMPLGFREANALVRKASLQVAQSVATLQNQEELVAFQIQHSYRQLVQSFEQVRIQTARRKAALKQLDARLEQFRAGLGEFTFLLQSQSTVVDATLAEQMAICDYNNAIADFQRSRGSILVHDNIKIEEGNLPPTVEARASAYLEQYRRALKLRERPPQQAPEDTTGEHFAGPWLISETLKPPCVDQEPQPILELIEIEPSKSLPPLPPTAPFAGPR
jgi:outer membrane protein TolC